MLVVISGCSGGGKSTLIAELAGRGYATVPEPGRRIVAAETALGGSALPWVDRPAFARRAMAMARADVASAPAGTVFFDRGLVDAAVALAHAMERPMTRDVLVRLVGPRPPYHRRVFLTPPWPAIYARDDARRHGFAEAVAEYERLLLAYPALGYEVAILPETSLAARADIVLSAIVGERSGDAEEDHE